MTVTVLFFASLADLMGADQQTLELPEGSTVASLLDVLEQARPGLKAFERRFRVAQNQSFVDFGQPILDGAELALIPPVSGGSGPSIAVAISASPLDSDKALQAVRRKDCGAVVLFLGTVREITGEMVTQRLDYSAYQAMAEKELLSLCEEAALRFELGALVVEHRVGTLEPGEIAVVVAASSVHRDGAFQGARFLIDKTKERVPLWKKEFGPDGSAWIEGDARVSSPGNSATGVGFQVVK
jgi:molybdopterin synthase catalytic subunit